MPPELSIAICTYNPRRPILARTLEHLRNQKFAGFTVELVVVDNASRPAVTEAELALDTFPFPARLVAEPEPGLIAARRRAFQETTGALLLCVDDDNFLDPNYAAEVVDFFRKHPKAGVVGGRTIALPETPPPPWFDANLLSYLAVRDLGDQPIQFLDDRTPYGAGMALRREAMAPAIGLPFLFTGRKGDYLSSYEDSELCYRLRIDGWQLWYWPALRLDHFLTSGRLTSAYLERLHEAQGWEWPCLEFFWAKGRPWRRLTYLKRWLKTRWELATAKQPGDGSTEADQIRWRLRQAFNRGLARSLLRLSFGPPLWRNVPTLTPGR